MSYVKRSFLYTIFIILFMFNMTITTLAEEAAIDATVLANNVNYRSDPDLESEVIGTLSLGDNVTILSASNDSKWYHITDLNGLDGWVLNDFVLVKDSLKDPIQKGIVNGDNLNLRLEPNLSSNILLTLAESTQLSIIETIDGWYKASLDNGTTGWVYSTYVDIIPNYSLGIITGNDVNLRTHPSVDSEIIENLPINLKVKIKNYNNDWYEILLPDNQTGWIYKTYLVVTLSENSTIVSRSVDRTSIKIIDYAKKLLDSPYVYGAAGPSKFDCSGFTYYVFKKNGIELPRTSSSQSNEGLLVTRNDLMMGDLVFFDTSGKVNGQITHVGIYIGSGEFIHASSGKNAKKVVISTLSEGYYYERFIRGRRIL